MNGVRRFLGGNGTAAATETGPESPTSTIPPTLPPLQTTAPLSFAKGPSWPPSAESPPSESPVSNLGSPKATATPALNLRKEKRPSGDSLLQKSGSHVRNSYSSSSLRSDGKPSSRRSINTLSGRPPRKSISPTRTNANPRDRLIMSLLASEALLESKEYDVLEAEEVEELKKEQAVVSARLIAASKKLGLETKIRDAALSLSRANAGYKNTSRQTADQLAAAERKVEIAQRDYLRVAERAGDINRRLLEHRAAVLGFSVRTMEKQLALPGTANNELATPDGTRGRASPVSSVPSEFGAQTRFEGAHLFAGHPNTVSPFVPRSLSSEADITALETRLKEATQSLATATQKQAELNRELAMLRLDKDQLETSMGMDLQSAEERIGALQSEMATLREEGTRAQELGGVQDILAARDTEIADLRKRLEAAENRASGLASAQTQSQSEEIAELKEALSAERAAWELERVDLDARIHQMEGDMGRSQQSDVALKDAMAQNDQTLVALQNIVQKHGIAVGQREPNTLGLVASLGEHINLLVAEVEVHARAEQEWEAIRKKLQTDAQASLDRQQALVQDLEEARREREEARKDAREADARLKEQMAAAVLSPTSTARALVADMDVPTDIAKVIATLSPIWSTLPSPETRAMKMTGRAYRTSSPASPGSNPGSPKVNASLSEMDVRSLKTLYDPNAVNPRATAPAPVPFTIENFAQRVQALVVDDRLLIERLIRFAQAHDLLKKNAERAQKLAQESNSALETYQRQVKTLEERNIASLEKQSELESDVHKLQLQIDRVQQERLEIEQRAAEQAETTRQLSEANDTLSARALALAQEAATAGDGARRQLDTQLADLKAALAKAQEEAAVLQERNMTMTFQQAEMEEELQRLRSRR